MDLEEFVKARALFTGVHGLVLHSLSQPGEGTTVVTVDEIAPDPEAEVAPSGDEKIDRMLRHATPLSTRAGHRRYVIAFEGPAVMIRDESYAEGEEEEDFSSPLRTYVQSAFLDFVRESTFSEAIDGPLTHVKLVTYDVVVDAAVRQVPEITVRRLGARDLMED